MNLPPSLQNAQIEKTLRDIGDTIKSALPDDYGYALVLFSFEGPQLYYTSNGDREDVIKTLQELIGHLEQVKE